LTAAETAATFAAVKVYLVRHAHAVSDGPQLPDEQRYLSAGGREVARSVGNKLRAAGVRLHALLTSPLVRAVQTAELLAQGLGFAHEVETLYALAPGFAPRLVAERVDSLVEALGPTAAVALVGHEPGITALGAHLIGGRAFPQFRPGQVTLVEERRAIWTFTPDALTFVRLDEE
jgi:phosphohistidine phosphatase